MSTRKIRAFLETFPFSPLLHASFMLPYLDKGLFIGVMSTSFLKVKDSYVEEIGTLVPPASLAPLAALCCTAFSESTDASTKDTISRCLKHWKWSRGDHASNCLGTSTSTESISAHTYSNPSWDSTTVSRSRTKTQPVGCRKP